MLAAPSLRKRPTKVPNLKSPRPFAFFAWARQRISVKMHSTGSRFVIGLSNILFVGVCVCVHFFSPEILQAGAVKGLRTSKSSLCLSLTHIHRHTHTPQQRLTDWLIKLYSHGKDISTEADSHLRRCCSATNNQDSDRERERKRRWLKGTQRRRRWRRRRRMQRLHRTEATLPGPQLAWNARSRRRNNGLHETHADATRETKDKSVLQE